MSSASRKGVIAKLQQTQLFGRLELADLERLGNVGSLEKHPKGHTLMREGDLGADAWLLVAGSVSVMKGKFEVARRHAGALLGELALLDSSPRSASIKAIEPITVFRLTRDAVEQLFQHRSFARALVSTLTSKLREGTEQQAEAMAAREAVKDAFVRYVSADVLDEILASADPQSLLSGKLADATVLFTDIRGFSTISESVSPRELIELLREYFGRMIEVVMMHDGYVNKFIGDALLVIFNLPLPREDAAIAAVRTALDMQTVLAKLNRDRKRKGQFAVETGIGVHSGRVIAGNIGSLARMEYTVIGDAVNLGARLEGLTKHYGVPILVSEATWKQLGNEFVCRPVDLVRVKGKSTPTKIFEVCAIRRSAPDTIARKCKQYAVAFEHYLARRWAQCEKTLSAERGLATDRPSQILRDRCRSYASTPPPTTWDGVHTMQEK